MIGVKLWFYGTEGPRKSKGTTRTYRNAMMKVLLNSFVQIWEQGTDESLQCFLRVTFQQKGLKTTALYVRVTCSKDKLCYNGYSESVIRTFRFLGYVFNFANFKMSEMNYRFK